MKLKIVYNKIFYRSFGSVLDVYEGIDYENYESFRWH